MVETTAVTKEQVKRVMDEVDALDLPDGAHWAMVHERLGLEDSDVFDIIASDPAFFRAIPKKSGQPDAIDEADDLMQMEIDRDRSHG